MPSYRLPALLTLALACLCGCAHPAPTPSAFTPDLAGAPPAPAQFRPDVIDGTGGTRVLLPHYVIYTTITDRTMLARVGQLLETALAAYHALAPEVPVSARPMECYIFESRAQWAAYTKAHTGDDAAIYLRVNRGGYTINDKFVAYWIGDTGTFSVAAHEGWHQYVARHLKGRLPPFLEEGLACMFEQVTWPAATDAADNAPPPRFDVAKNHPRLSALRAAADADDMYPLARLLTMHAGQVVGKRSAKIEAFYAESWAFARFLHEAHPAALRRMLADASRGTLYADNSTDDPTAGGPLWDPASAKPMLEHYLAMPVTQIEPAFARYVRDLIERP